MPRPLRQRPQKKKRHGLPWFVSSPWFPLVVVIVLLEFAVLIYLATKLESMSSPHNHIHNNHGKQHQPWNVASVRRQVLRWFSPQWRQKAHTNLRRDALESISSPAFHHSQLAARNRFLIPRHDSAVNNNNNNNKTLDNFYTRPHILPSLKKVPFLIVGGSDGSGTRTFVQTLMELGVTMIVDDANTMDVHGEEMTVVDAQGKKHFGWPPLVQMVLNATHSANYTVQDLPRAVQEQAIEALLQLKSSLLQKGKDARKSNPSSLLGHAAGVQYGWKAPISMVLLPLLQHVFGPIKFIHVVRDGRDVALSDNQSPLQKFYSVYYDQDPKSSPDYDDAMTERERSVQLWNDWNHQALQWEQHQQQYQQEQLKLAENDRDDMQHFDYMVMRTEDLIHPDTRLEALVQLAEFVGARVTPDQLCCRSHQYLHDLGESGLREGGPLDRVLEDLKQGTTPEDEKVVMARYGKWKQLLQNEPDVVTRLQAIGAVSLKAFGYNPSVRFMDESSDVRAFSCEEKTHDKMHCS